MEISDLLNYIGLTSLSTGGFYILYHFLFKKGHHFHFNRFLILTMVLLPFGLPFISVNIHQDPIETINQFGFGHLTDYWETGALEINNAAHGTGSTSLDLLFWLFLLYCSGVAVFLIRYVMKLLSIRRLIRQNELIKKDNYYYIKLKEGQSTFSFCDYIFTNQKFLEDENEAMFLHEQCHVDQRHTYDLLLVELLLALQWFNPLIYLFKNRLVETHEFLADESVLKSGLEKISYMKVLMEAASVNLTHGLMTSHFNSMIYKRILTMNTDRKIEFKVWKLIFPVALGALVILVHSGFKNQSLDSVANKIRVTKISSSYETLLFRQPIKKEELYKISSGYGMRMHPILKEERMHQGIDYAAEKGVEIHAALGGKVRTATFKEKYGNLVIIDHDNGFSTLYSQMDKILVKAGDEIEVDEVIGTVGSTGLSTAPHLHFEIMKNGKHVNPIDYLVPYE